MTKVNLMTDNQAAIISDNMYIFQSYNQPICKYSEDSNELTVTTLWNFSKTTTKWFYRFLDLYCGSWSKTKEILTAKTKSKVVENLIKTGAIKVVAPEQI